MTKRELIKKIRRLKTLSQSLGQMEERKDWDRFNQYFQEINDLQEVIENEIDGLYLAIENSVDCMNILSDKIRGL